MSVLIVYGEQGSGKSRLVEPLTRLYRLSYVVGEWDGRSPSVADLDSIPGGCLVLTNAETTVVEDGEATWLHVDAAKDMVAKVRPAA
ncbi:hypothetical protein [Halomonas elongata]|uniref:Uncharacterized protein n=1 Tax=Halomonas elongata (strain ATCC 33173 / DSM 2581 / NBRC 15536 / NCIMB 2198 / 1H9) TaxID=768066 RepID=A0ABZ0T5Z5_HALED|nr:hypothetical protein [Halomonas elongata]WBF17837.1 hypothetical protein LM502_17495 [Halomonas elongata]WPU46682.1 hypothetical protein SR933_15745 [Halomonas elongata DSM 2581]